MQTSSSNLPSVSAQQGPGLQQGLIKAISPSAVVPAHTALTCDAFRVFLCPYPDCKAICPALNHFSYSPQILHSPVAKRTNFAMFQFCRGYS